MRNFLNKISILILLIVFSTCSLSQIKLSDFNKRFKDSRSEQMDIMTIGAGLLTVLYLFNPVLAWKDNKLYGGFTKEFSVGFGMLGEHRGAVEYTYIFAGENRHALRFSYKYDIMMMPGVQPSNMLQLIPAMSIGGGYFTDFEKNGIFPEVSYGFSVRNHKILIYPHIKARYTYILNKAANPDFKDNADVSVGIMIGIANPFIDLKIRRQY